MTSSFRRARKAGGDAAAGSFRGSGRTVQLDGTKAWTGGVMLTSFGHEEMDQILGGGQPLGTAVLVEEDRWTMDLGRCLARYWAAEAMAQGQTLLLPATSVDASEQLPTSLPSSEMPHCGHFPCSSEDGGGTSPSEVESFVRCLPRDLHLDKRRSISVAPSKSSATANATSTILEEEPDMEEDEDDSFPLEAEGIASQSEERNDEHLKIAWQYKQTVQSQRLGHHFQTASAASNKTAHSRRENGYASNQPFCHSYDLDSFMFDQYSDNPSLLLDRIHILDSLPTPNSLPPTSCQSRLSAFQFFSNLLPRLSLLQSNKPDTVIRLLFLSPPIHCIAIVLPLLLAHIRTHSLPIVILLTIRPWTLPSSSSSLISLRRSSDVVFALDGFSSMRSSQPSEFRHLVGLMTLRKVAPSGPAHFMDATVSGGAGRQQKNTTSPFSSSSRPLAQRFGFKRDRRKLHISMLHLPPEDFVSQGSSVGASVPRTGGGRPSADAGHPDQSTKNLKISCSSSHSNVLDF